MPEMPSDGDMCRRILEKRGVQLVEFVRERRLGAEEQAIDILVHALGSFQFFPVEGNPAQDHISFQDLLARQGQPPGMRLYQNTFLNVNENHTLKKLLSS